MKRIIEDLSPMHSEQNIDLINKNSLAMIGKIEKHMANNPRDVRWNDLVKVCDYYFGEPKKKGSHRSYRIPWPEGPHVILTHTSDKDAALYQVTRALKAIKKLKEEQIVKEA